MPHAVSRLNAGDIARMGRPAVPASVTKARSLLAHVLYRRTGNPLRRDMRSSRGDDQAARGHDHPVAVLSLDLLDAPEPRHKVARLDFDDAVAALDQRGGGAIDLAQRP